MNNNLFILTLVLLAMAASTLADGQGCLAHAARERNAKNPLALVPECNADGTYKSLQCHPESVGGKRFCQCWNKEGDIIRSPSQKTKACECHLQRHAVAANGRNGVPLIGAFQPSCAIDGTYEKRQCHGSTGMCWCADPETGEQKGQKIRGELNCS